MDTVIPYHHPDDSQYSLAYVTQDRDSISAPNKDAIIERYECDVEFFVLYTNHGASGTVDDIDDEFDAVLDGMSPEDRILAIRFLQIFEGIIDEKEVEEDEKLEIYKQIELEKVPDAISHVDWNQTIVAVAGQMMSSLILKHALPNANHRTSISLAEWYLESTNTGFSLPELATEDYAWKHWVDDYITESKRLLTVRRNTTAFSLLHNWGCTTIKRKGDIEIKLAQYNLDYSHSDALRHYAETHTELCTDFMIESVKRAGYEELLQADGPSKTEFIDYLEQTK
jgi:prophage maintenance system killer protein